jgi:two-component system sensor histidine kinase and response regulator WspE
MSAAAHPLGDPAMLDLFRTEVETHAATMNHGLLSLEQAPGDAAPLASLMRAAHSIKGAARIVKVEPAVELAHAAEDVFVAAQEGALAVTPEAIDLLLKATDLLARIGALARNESAGELASLGSEVEALVPALHAVRDGEAAPAASAPAEAPAEAPAPAAPAGPAPAPADTAGDFVRVSAENLNRLMDVSGETVVRVRWLESLADSLRDMRATQASLASSVDRLDTLIEPDEARAKTLVQDARERLRTSRHRLAESTDAFGDFALRLANLSDRLYHETIETRMRPFADGVHGFPRMVRDLARKLGKKVRLEIEGQETHVDRDVLEKLEAPLTHLLRNALGHGLELPDVRAAAGKPTEGLLRLAAHHRAGMVSVTVSDDGRGIDVEALRQKVAARELVAPDVAAALSPDELFEFLFLPGFSTAAAVTELSGRGVGLDVVRDLVRRVGGSVRLTTTPGKGTQFHLLLPVTLSVIRALLVEIDGEPYAFRLTQIDRCLKAPRADVALMEGRRFIRNEQDNVALIDTRRVLSWAPLEELPDDVCAVLASDRQHGFALVVDRFLGQRDLVVRPLDPRLGKLPCISAAAITEDGTPVLLLDVDDILRAVEARVSGDRGKRPPSRSEAASRRVLVVDDSPTVRAMARRLLETAGYTVDLATDGMDGWNAVSLGRYDLLVTDIDMPRMDGLELTRRVRASQALKGLPVVIVSYKDKPEDRSRGTEAGANAYLSKSTYGDGSLVQSVAELIGGGTGADRDRQ